MSEAVKEVEGDGEREEELECEDGHTAQMHRLQLGEDRGEVAGHDENPQGGEGEDAGLDTARTAVGDRHHAGQLGLVDGQVGGQRSAQFL